MKDSGTDNSFHKASAGKKKLFKELRAVMPTL